MKLAILMCVFVALAVAQIPPAPPAAWEWEDVFAPPYQENGMPQIALSMDCVDAKLCYLAGVSNGQGAGVYQYDGQVNGQVTAMNAPNFTMMITDLVVGGTLQKPTGVFTGVVDFTIGAGLEYLTNNGQEWLASKMPWELVWASESVANSGANTFVAVGAGMAAPDFMVSNDGGATFTEQPLNWNPPTNPNNCTGPGDLTIVNGVWYLTYTAQPDNNQVHSKYLKENEEVIVTKAGGQVIVIRNKVTKAVRTHVKRIREWRADMKAAKLAKVADDSCNYYAGYIIQSTDNGKTWTQQFQSTWAVTQVYCASTTHCLAVGFDDSFSYVILTQDGKNWKIVLKSPPATSTEEEAIGAIGFASTDGQTVWAGGAVDMQGPGGSAVGVGVFWKSTDGGSTWTQQPTQQPNLVAVMAIDFIGDIGFALALSEFQTSTILKYAKQSDYGFFVQSQCQGSGCFFLCQNASFPQGFCLQTQGGSALVFCSAAGLQQLNYETTSCQGDYKESTDPVNVCLNATDGSSYTNYCPPAREILKQRKPAMLKRRNL